MFMRMIVYSCFLLYLLVEFSVVIFVVHIRSPVEVPVGCPSPLLAGRSPLALLPPWRVVVGQRGVGPGRLVEDLQSGFPFLSFCVYMTAEQGQTLFGCLKEVSGVLC